MGEMAREKTWRSLSTGSLVKSITCHLFCYNSGHVLSTCHVPRMVLSDFHIICHLTFLTWLKGFTEISISQMSKLSHREAR